jgi:hypothetical protein
MINSIILVNAGKSSKNYLYDKNELSTNRQFEVFKKPAFYSLEIGNRFYYDQMIELVSIKNLFYSLYHVVFIRQPFFQKNRGIRCRGVSSI